MQIVNPGQNFCFNYTAYDQDPALNVAFTVYDVSGLSPALLSFIPATYVGFGVYSCNFTPAVGKTYMIIGAVYLDSMLTTPDSSRGPAVEFFQSQNGGTTGIFVAYAAYDLDDTLDVRSKVYDLITGGPVFVQNVTMTDVALGVYIGKFTGVSGHTYQIASVVYTDNTFTVPDPNWAPACQQFQCFNFTGGVTYELANATIVGQRMSANLVGDRT